MHNTKIHSLQHIRLPRLNCDVKAMLMAEISNMSFFWRGKEGAKADILYMYYLFMHPEQSYVEIQQSFIQLVLFISGFQINANDSLWPWSCDQTVGDFKTGKSWLIAEPGGGGTGRTIFPGPRLTRDQNWNEFTVVLML